MHIRKIFWKHGWPSPVLILVLACLTLSLDIVRAQEPIRQSLAGEDAAGDRELEKEQQSSAYNLKLGPVLLQVDVTQGFEYNDNINLSENNPKDDIISHSKVQVSGYYPVSEVNSFNFNVGLGYDAYFFNPSANSESVLLAPDSKIGFDMFVSDFRINFYDEFSYTQDPLQVVGVVGTDNFGQYTNAAGVAVDWDMNDVILTAGYEHGNSWVTNQRYEYLNNSSETFTGRATFLASPTIKTGVESSFSLLDYDKNGGINSLNDGYVYTAGPFIEVQLSPYLTVSGRAGYSGGTFDSGNLAPGITNIGGDENISTYYARGIITNRLNRYFSHSLSGGRETELGINSNYYERTYVEYSTNWAVMRDTSITLMAFYEFIEDSPSIAAEDIDRYGVALVIGRTLTKRLSMNAGYRFTQNNSDILGRDFTQNSFTVDFNYRF